MEKKYESFVEDFRQQLMDITGYGEERIFYKKKEDYPPTEGDRMFVRRVEEEGISEVCALYVGELYEEYKSGKSMDAIIRSVIQRMNGLERADFVARARELGDYDKIRRSLFVRLLNIKKYEEELEDSVYRAVGDIALVLYIQLGELEGMTASMKVKKLMMDAWKTNTDEVFEGALLNTYFLSPPRIYCWEKMIFNTRYVGENFMNILSDYPIRKDAVGNCLSTVRRTNGAVAVFLPGVAERLSCLLQGNFYLVFTSVHEVMIHGEKTVDPEDLKHVLADTVRETTPEEDFLTLNIYYYDRDSGVFSLCEEGEME